ncbi:hypothetical protein [Pseudomonas coronafaciens]|uniref:hypothetical protein n=1 Tax=Pseudomonas coronafaciens TaxID=53409 RepID=UPI000AE6FE0F|nr:hypothetical protein [Pseudomonas coronafaciens]
MVNYEKRLALLRGQLKERQLAEKFKLRYMGCEPEQAEVITRRLFDEHHDESESADEALQLAET